MSRYKATMFFVVLLMGTLIGNSFTLGLGPANNGYNIDIDQEEVDFPVSKHEAVFSALSSDGTVIETRILNHLSTDDNVSSPWVVDFGGYVAIRNLTSDAQGYLMNDRVYWPTEAFRNGELYYEGFLEKPLPVSTNIRYRLDGEEIAPEALPGKSGKLEIILSFENIESANQAIEFMSSSGDSVAREDQNYVPFVVQGTVPLDLRAFSNISVNNGAVVEIGQTANVSFMMFPYPKAETVIFAEGENIELEPITITLMPQMPPVNEMDMAEDLKELLYGLGDIQNGMESLYQGLSEVNDGTVQADQGISDMIAQIAYGLDAMEEGMLELSGGLGELQAGLGKAEGSLQQLFDGLSTGTNEIAAGLTALYDASDQVLSGLEELSVELRAVLEPLDPVLDNIDETLAYLESLETENIVPVLEDLAEMLDHLLTLLQEQSQGELQDSLDQFHSDLTGVLNQKGELDQSLEDLMINNDKIEQAAETLMKENPEGSDLYRLGALLLVQGDSLKKLKTNTELIEESLSALEESALILEEDTEAIIADIVMKFEQLIHEVAEQNNIDPEVFQMLFVYLNNSIEYIRQLQLTLPLIREQVQELRNLPSYLEQLVEGQRQIRDGIKSIRDEGIAYMLDGIEQAEDAFSLGGILQAVGLIDFGAKTLLEEGLKPLKEGVNTARNNLSLGPLIEAQGAITDGMDSLIRQGLQPMRDGLKTGVDEILFAEEKLLLMEKLAENYRSFADNDHNDSSQVRFIMQTPELSLTESTEGKNAAEEEEKSFFDELLIRFMRLFEGE